jgi:hypothetical protein
MKKFIVKMKKVARRRPDIKQRFDQQRQAAVRSATRCRAAL